MFNFYYHIIKLYHQIIYDSCITIYSEIFIKKKKKMMKTEAKIAPDNKKLLKKKKDFLPYKLI
jgi:hypothetical protein